MITPLFLFFLTLGIHPQVQACGGEYTALTGLILSPLYPSQYPPDQDCVYIIRAPTGYRITLTFDSFDVAGDWSSCKQDYIQIKDGESGTSPFLSIYCNTTAYPRRSTSNTMWIRFHSDSTQSGGGFHASYTAAIIPLKFLLITESNLPWYVGIRNIDIDTNTLFDIPLEGLKGPAGVDYDPMTGRVYWTDNGEQTIRASNLNGSDARLVRYLGLASVPDGLCVDALSRLIFYTDAGNKVIGMITMYSNTHRIVINSSLDMPKDIELDKRNGVIYWSDRGATPTIERANYDGTGRQTLVSGGEYLKQPNAIALDTVEGRLYWADGGTQKVGWVDLEGRKTSVILPQPGLVYHGMDLYLNDFFVTDWSFLNLNKTIKTRIVRYGKDGSNGRSIFGQPSKLNDIRVYAEEIEDKGPNGCGSNNGGCSYICVPTPGNRSKCLTEDGGSTKTESPTTGISTKAMDLVTPSSTSDPSISSEAESVSTNTKIIITVCVVAAVVGIAVIIALVVFRKRRQVTWEHAFFRMIRCAGQNNSQEHGDSTQRSNTPDVPLESLPATTNNISIVNNQHNDQSSQSGYREGNSNDTGETRVKQGLIIENWSIPTQEGDNSHSNSQEVSVDDNSAMPYRCEHSRASECVNHRWPASSQQDSLLLLDEYKVY
ncbi:low-density lipoprotein receptor-related protein 4-like isoform X2 [Pomacea canaliculata]|uniref:low-density lipoprotein receptor-related protein 4-like isoform X2 n=1 Tax=Pomacea canaliculata TaxID=400727 RepID=UPI000D728431|nr:low-density lipoprotein receptor-related protein 4-like isoform X2 [Pomacea canaliculata]